MEKFFTSSRPWLLSAMRMVVGFLFALHGAQKILGFPAPPQQPFDLFTLSGTAGVLELFGGLLVMVGLFTRPTAFVLSGLMAFAYFIAHAPRSFWPLLNGGELAAMYCFVFLYLAAAGPGVWSVDHLLKSRKTNA